VGDNRKAYKEISMGSYLMALQGYVQGVIVNVILRNFKGLVLKGIKGNTKTIKGI
jgi:hypothetical protein